MVSAGSVRDLVSELNNTIKKGWKVTEEMRLTSGLHVYKTWTQALSLVLSLSPSLNSSCRFQKEAAGDIEVIIKAEGCEK